MGDSKGVKSAADLKNFLDEISRILLISGKPLRSIGVPWFEGTKDREAHSLPEIEYTDASL